MPVSPVQVSTSLSARKVTDVFRAVIDSRRYLPIASRIAASHPTYDRPPMNDADDVFGGQDSGASFDVEAMAFLLGNGEAPAIYIAIRDEGPRRTVRLEARSSLGQHRVAGKAIDMVMEAIRREDPSVRNG